MLFHWFRLRGCGYKQTYFKAAGRLAARKGRPRLEQLEDRCCPSVSLFTIGTDRTIPATGSVPFVKGEHVQFSVTVNSTTEPNEDSEDEVETTAITSSIPDGFHAQVDAFTTQTFNYVIKQNGESFAISTSDGDETGTVTVIVNSPGLKFVQQPSLTLAGTTMAPVVVQAVDALGQPLGDFNGDVTLTLGNNPAGGTLNNGSPITVQAQGGIATFANLSIDKPGRHYSLIVSLADGTQISSSYFNIGEKLAFVQQPTDGFPGQAIAPAVSVAVENADGTPDTAFSGNITLGFANDPTQGIAKLSGNVATVHNGVATFPNLSIDVSGVGYALLASTSDGSQAASSNFRITHFLSFTEQPSGVAAGQAMTPAPAVTVYGPDGFNVDTGYSGTVTIKLSTDPSNGTAKLTGNVATALDGVAVFPDLKISQAGAGYTLAASISDDAQIISSSFNVGVNLVFKKDPAAAVPGKPISPVVAVEVDEPDGSPDTAYSGNVTLAFAADPTKGVAKLSGNVAMVRNGVAVFPNLVIDSTGLNYALTASATGAVSTTTGPFNVAHVVNFRQPPADGLVGARLAPVKVSVYRADGVTLDTGYAGPVTLAIGHDASQHGNAHLLGVVTVLASKGVATFSTLSIDQTGNNYTLVASVPDGAQKTSNAFNINTNLITQATLKILSNPTSRTSCIGETVTFTAAAAGFPVASVQWQVSSDGGKNFTNIPGATSDSLTVTAVAGQGTKSGQNGDLYRAAFTNAANPVNTAAATLTVNVPPKVAGGGDPQDANVSAGQKATFTAVEANGGPAPKVQWQVSTDGGLTFSNLVSGVTVANKTTSGGETSTLSFTATAGQIGNLYRAVFSNHCSTATATALLKVTNAKPVVIGQPASHTVIPGQAAILTAAATGNPAPTVQWMVSTDGGKTFSAVSTGASSSNIPNGVATTLNLTPTLAQSGAKYEVIFTNSAGQAVSKAATLTVIVQPTLTATGNLQSQTVTAGQKVTLTAAATGKPAPLVQWQMTTDGGKTFRVVAGGKTATKVSAGVETATLSFVAQPALDGAEFVAVFFNSAGLAFTSPLATLTVHFAPQVTTQPAKQGVAAGGQATFTAAAIGDPAPASVKWQVSTDKGKTWQDLPGGSSTPISQGLSASLTLTNIAASQNGAEYRAVFTAGTATATTKPATLTLGTLPQVTSTGNPLNRSAAVGQKNVTFSAAATTGSPAARVQWQVSSDGGLTFTPFTAGTVATATVSGVITTTLTLTASAAQNGALFRAVLSNVAGTVPTSAASLTVTSPPVVVNQPTDQTVTAGQTATFAALAAGTPNPTVQWQIFNTITNTWDNVAAGTVSDAFTGATANVFTLTTTAGDKGKTLKFRAVFTNTIGATVNTVVSDVVMLTVA